MQYLPAFLLGILGSLHCLGMCGPLAMALPSSGKSRPEFVIGRLLYNVGRICTYMLLGALFGLIGKTLVLAGLQQWLTIVVGIVLLAFVIVGKSWSAHLQLLRPVYAGIAVLKKTLGKFLQKRSAIAMTVIGLLNGLLPCGLVYVALAGASLEGSLKGGALYMGYFGLGTFPLMFAVALTGQLLQRRFRFRLQRLVPVALSLLAVLFILRGLGLGIPYISPNLNAVGAEKACCH